MVRDLNDDGDFDDSNELLASTTTDINGNYSFKGLTPGLEYQVVFNTPLGYDAASPRQSDGNPASGVNSDGRTSDVVVLAPGEYNPTLDAGFYRLASLGDRVWEDTNANGQQDGGESGIPGATVKLYTCVNGAPGVLVATTTDGAGNYNFGNLTPGDYIVEFITPADYTRTQANVGGDGTDSDAGVGGLTGCYNLQSGETDNTADAGLYYAAVDIEKFVRGEYRTGGTEGLTPGFWKTHSEFGPSPLAGWPETGYSPTQSWEAIFGVDVPGTPTLLEALGSGGGGLNALLRHSTAALLNAANPNVDYAYSVAQVISLTQAAVSSGDYEATKDLFEAQNEKGADLSTPAPSVTIVVTPDFDADTPGSGPQILVGGKAVFTYVVKNSGSVEIGNVVVTDDRLSGLTFTGGDTDGDGRLDPTEIWTYRAEEIVTSSAEKANIGTVTGMAGTTPVTDSDAAHYSGTALTQSLGDYIWLANRNGIQDSGETGIGGLLVTLTGGGADGIINGVGDTTATTSTDQDGYYQFNGLSAGVQYQVTFSKPGGTAYTMRDAGANDARDSDADVVTGKSQIVILEAGQNNPTLDAGVYVLTPGIDIEKTTDGPTNAGPVAPDYDNEDAADGAGVPILSAGSTVTWTYKVTNTGDTNFARADIAIVDDNGTPGNAGDDMTIANGRITYQSGDDGDNVLEAGETWLYQASGTVQSLGGLGPAISIDFSGSSASDGGDGNTRTYTAGGVTVNVNAWSRDKGTDSWQKAWLGAYAGGLGVTDSSEGSGANDSHTVDNDGRDNYLVFRFSQNVVVDKAFLGYVVGDSDMTVYVGSSAAPITGMSNAVLNGMALKEFNDTASTTTRWADFNTGNVEGNVLILAARDDGHAMDSFKVEQLVFRAVQSGGVYENKATVTVPGGLSDADLSHYVTTPPAPGIEIVKDASVSSVAPDTPVTYTYAVKNTGGVALGNIVVKDDNGTPNFAGDDFSPAAVLGANGKNVGDLDGDGLLDTTEVWQYSATVIPPLQMTVTVNGVVHDSGTLSYTTLANGDIRVTYLQSQGINDNNYAASGNAPSWNGSHTFSNLTGSDKAGFELKDGNGKVVLKFYQDYLTSTSSNTDGYANFSGYASLGATGGDGKMLVGSAASLYDFDTTLEQNLNRAGYTGMTSNSPVDDPNWEYVNGYMFTVKASAFGAAGFGGVRVFDQHDSPSKVGVNSMVPDVKYGPSTNVATVSGTANGTTVSDSDDATVNIQAPARIGDRVWCDTDGDGVQDTGEIGVAGVTVKLLSAAGAVLATTTTDSNGNYSFSASPGTYKVQVVKPAAFGGFTSAHVGSDDAVDSDVDGSGLSGPVTVAAGQTVTSVDAGLTRPTVTLTYDFSGSSATDGGDGNTRSYTVDGVTVTARAVSRHVDSNGNAKWETAWLGTYSGGLGVTDRGEGSGGGNSHTVDNVGRVNYVVFQFSQNVVVDKAFLGYVAGDSDLTAWIGSS